MPGPVIEGHAKYETECSRCHRPFSKATQSDLCLDCHETERDEIAAGEGFHGRRMQTQTIACRTCHTEHEGRDKDVVQLDAASFDHRMTDFALEKRHRGVACSSCHKDRDKSYREAPDECVACHREQDVHLKGLGEDCAECHDPGGWRGAEFDHDKTDFPLHFRHAEVQCGACHLKGLYENTPSRCHSCHLLADVHGGRNGEDCAECHDEERWDNTAFDHDKDTDFPLRGLHARQECVACHTENPFEVKVDGKCLSCHRPDDVHAGAYGNACNDCHRPDGWRKTTFDHDRKTDFDLSGKHAKIDCKACHAAGVPAKRSESACIACHKTDDVHRGSQGEDCQRCHQSEGWTHRTVFDHDLTAFPLIGLHGLVACESCHESSRFSGTAVACNECHETDDVHKGRLESACGSCHNPNGWELWQYDHSKTDFPLEGAHQGLACKGCHQSTLEEARSAGHACVQCHARDDEHRGRFGPACDRCHSQEEWGSVSIR